MASRGSQLREPVLNGMWLERKYFGPFPFRYRQVSLYNVHLFLRLANYFFKMLKNLQRHFSVTRKVNRSDYVRVRIAVVWDVMPCSLVDMHISEGPAVSVKRSAESSNRCVTINDRRRQEWELD
jgi:hypothetical protein